MATKHIVKSYDEDLDLLKSNCPVSLTEYSLNFQGPQKAGILKAKIDLNV